MNIKKTVFVAVAAFGILSACGEKKAKEVRNDAITTPELTTEMKEEIAKKEAETRLLEKKKADSLRKVDSLQQVKEHGHVH